MVRMGTAKYIKVVEWIQHQIATKELLPGAKIHSENELSQMFQLSRQTIRHAIGLLEEKGIVIRVKGSGTYVNINLGPFMLERTRIALVTTYVDTYIFPKTIQGIEQVLSREGYSVQVSFTNNLVDRERAILEDIIQKNEVAGILMEPTRSGLPNPNLDLYYEIKKLRIPILFLHSFYKELDIPHVSLNDRVVASRATKYLIDKGHTNIGAILKSDDGQGHLRYAGYYETMRAAGLTINDRSIVWIDTYDIQHMMELQDYLIARFSACTAILCYNDQVAYELIACLTNAKIRVPDDISVIGIDGSEYMHMSDVKITSLPHPLERLGEKAANHLVEMIHNPLFHGTFEFDAEVYEQTSVKQL